MIAIEQARAHLETLGLSQAVEVLDSRMDDAAGKQLPYPEMLVDLLGTEVSARRERYLTTRTRMAKLPFHRTLEEFDFSFQPSIDERQVKELATLAFVSEATNILLLGPPGVGKTHLAVALALKSIENRQGAYFVRAFNLMEDLRRARAENRLDRRMRIYLSPKVLIVDEFGIWPYDQESATAFFSLMSARYERAQQHPDLEQRLRRLGRVTGRQRDSDRGPRQIAAPQLRAEHPRRELQAKGQAPSRTADLTAPTWRTIRNARRKRAIGNRVGQIQLGENGTVPAWR